MKAEDLASQLPEGFGDDEISRAMKEAAELLAKVLKLADALELERAGREQDRADLAICIKALRTITRFHPDGNPRSVVELATITLKDIGAL